jgi:hypothetical protein
VPTDESPPLTETKVVVVAVYIGVASIDASAAAMTPSSCSGFVVSPWVAPMRTLPKR